MRWAKVFVRGVAGRRAGAGIFRKCRSSAGRRQGAGAGAGVPGKKVMTREYRGQYWLVAMGEHAREGAENTDREGGRAGKGPLSREGRLGDHPRRCWSGAVFRAANILPGRGSWPIGGHASRASHTPSIWRIWGLCDRATQQRLMGNLRFRSGPGLTASNSASKVRRRNSTGSPVIQTASIDPDHSLRPAGREITPEPPLVRIRLPLYGRAVPRSPRPVPQACFPEVRGSRRNRKRREGFGTP
jgi:hypothetical protein